MQPFQAVRMGRDPKPFKFWKENDTLLGRLAWGCLAGQLGS
jgi:hypothetical protein